MAYTPRWLHTASVVCLDLPLVDSGAAADASECEAAGQRTAVLLLVGGQQQQIYRDVHRLDLSTPGALVSILYLSQHDYHDAYITGDHHIMWITHTDCLALCSRPHAAPCSRSLSVLPLSAGMPSTAPATIWGKCTRNRRYDLICGETSDCM